MIDDYEVIFAGVSSADLCGNGLTAAIKSYQKSKGLEADGYCGANTWYELFN